MQISEIMNLIDENKQNEVGKLYKIDKVNNKITGKFIIKSFVHCILKGYKLSLRALELILIIIKIYLHYLKLKLIIFGSQLY
ncbi:MULTISPECIES: hypothetical protein [unclassified Candidatus Tisiphia]|uniref:hypothetical protein n=1 Tax=unclassified Candidatus Tisiphia TaxID=2996318 RepID=UPI00312C742B